ncbi:sodium/glutamate symporter [Micrococcoides hystricis]|uniref:Sodium/glutamate symporter n=1 Tax=Micrococcoides hystricis TaxID=1572761 RepID=A0ABV6P8T9_9MICC
MTPNQIGFALILLTALLLLGKWMRVKIGWVQKLFLPSSILAGFLALALGPQILGRLAEPLNLPWLADGGVFTEEILEVWKVLPGLLISVVFAALFLGSKVMSPRKVARLAGPQLSIGMAYATGQYIIGILLTMLLLAPLFGLHPAAGALIEAAFEGGHGTAAGMKQVFEDFGFEGGSDLALALATVGLVSGIIIGVAVINWAVRKGKAECLDNGLQMSLEEQRGLYKKDENVPAAMMTSRPSSIEPLSLHLAVVGLAILIGWLLLSGLQWLESVLWGEHLQLMEYLPLFPMAMLGGVIVQLYLDKTGNGFLLDQQMMFRIQGLALDLLIISALATLSLTAIAQNWESFLILSVAGVAFSTFVLVWLTPRILPSFWLERGVGDFGQSMGVTATGLILMRIADPEDKSPALEAFGYKSLAMVPFFGGGMITAAAIPLIMQFGELPFLIVMIVLFVASVWWGMGHFKKVKAGDVDDPVEEIMEEAEAQA